MTRSKSLARRLATLLKRDPIVNWKSNVRRLELEYLEVRLAPAVSFGSAINSTFAQGAPQLLAVGNFTSNTNTTQDVVITNANGYTFLRGDGTGNFTASPPVTVSGLPDPEGIATGYFNNDTKLDLVIVSPGEGTTPGAVKILLGNGDGTFTAGPTFPTLPAGAGPAYVTVADLNKDGNADLLISDYNKNQVYVYQGNGTGTFTLQQTLTDGIVNPEQIVVTDFDGNGTLDLAVTSQGNGTVEVFQGLGNGTFNTTATIVSLQGSGGVTTANLGSVGLAAGDLDGDGLPDLAVANYGTATTPASTLTLVHNTSTFGNISFGEQVAENVGTFLVNVAIGDFDGDGRNDVAVDSTGNFFNGSPVTDQHVYVFANQGATATQPLNFAAPITLTTDLNPVGLVAADVNGDEKPDLLTVNNDNTDLSVFLNTSTPPISLSAPLHVAGNQLENASGNSVVLRGVNVYSLEYNPEGFNLLASVNEAITQWDANVIRLPVNEDFWFGYQGSSYSNDGGLAYRTLVDQVIQTAAADGVYVVLDLHWSDEDVWGANNGQHEMPDDHSTLFWQEAAKRYANNPTVIYDPYNEPYGVDFATWLNGGTVNEGGVNYHSPGMQGLLNTIRGTGANNIVSPEGLNFDTDLSGITNGFALSDPDTNLLYQIHLYPGAAETDAERDALVGTVPQQYPLFVGEWGSDTIGDPNTYGVAQPDSATWNQTMLAWLNQHQYSWTAWAFVPASNLDLIEDVTNYTPTSFYGVYVKAALAAADSSKIMVTSGSGQSAMANTAFANPLVATVTDGSGNPLVGVVVTFAGPGSGAGVTFPGGTTATTNAQGQVSLSVTANTAAGSYAVTATVTGDTPASFAMTNNPGAAAAITVTSGNGQTALVNTAFAAPLVATISDAFGNPVPGVIVTFAGPGSGAGVTFPSGTTATTNAQGQATIGVTANASSGAFNVTATAAGVATPANFALTNTTTGVAPAITSANSTTFALGVAGTFTVTATGTPTPTLTENGTLPTGVTFNAATGVLSGTPTGTAGSSSITFTASNSVAPNATQNFTLIVAATGTAPAITSAASTTFVIGAAGTFTVTATGTPTPTLTESGTLPTGVIFNAATGVLSGTPTGTAGSSTITFTASNGVAPNATQNFTLTIAAAGMAPVFTSAASTSFVIGAAGTFTVTATGSVKPTLTVSGTLPTGVTFNATTGVLSGTPAAGTAGSFPLIFTASNGITPNATQNFTLTINPATTGTAPAFTNPATATFTTTVPSNFSVTFTGTAPVTVTETGTLPAGVTFNATTDVLSGQASPGTNGSYAITLTASNSIGSTSQAFTLTINSPIDELGAYRASAGSWSLDSDGTLGFNGATDQVFFSFSPKNVTGVAGDWTGSGHSDVGDFSIVNGVGTWHLDLNNNGILDTGETFQYGQTGDQPVVGDWTGSGVTNIGVFRGLPDGTGEFILDTNGDHVLDSGDQTFAFGLAKDRIVIGDWNGSGKDSVGVFREAVASGFPAQDKGDAVFSLDTNGDHTFDAGDQVFLFGLFTDGLIVGDWNGGGKTLLGVYREAVSSGFPAQDAGDAIVSLDSNGNNTFDASDAVFLYGVDTDQFVAGHWAKTPPVQAVGTPQAQFAANGPGLGVVSPLTPAQLQPVLDQAIAAWVADGASATQLDSVQVQIGTLDDHLVGETLGNQITLDATADGWGWNTDSSNADFTTSGPSGLQATPGSTAASQMDLLTVVEHELGHELGLSDVDPTTHPTSLMASILPVGTRRNIS